MRGLPVSKLTLVPNIFASHEKDNLFGDICCGHHPLEMLRDRDDMDALFDAGFHRACSAAVTQPDAGQRLYQQRRPP